jgi:hypothetical protein
VGRIRAGWPVEDALFVPKKAKRGCLGSIITKAEFARRTGRKPPSISQAIAGPLKAAVVAGGIDVAHEAVARWARKRGIDPASLG